MQHIQNATYSECNIFRMQHIQIRPHSLVTKREIWTNYESSTV